jgi:hypothetical protein
MRANLADMASGKWLLNPLTAEPHRVVLGADLPGSQDAHLARVSFHEQDKRSESPALK